MSNATCSFHDRRIHRFAATILAAATGLTLLAAAPASAGEPVRVFASAAVGVDLKDVPTMRVVLRPSLMNGRGGPTGFANRGPGCPMTTSSHTNPDPYFSGGTYIAQAGFGETEIAAASYTLAASAFPIKLNLAEFILVTSGASTQTVTEWSFLVWDGPPNTGTLVATYSSDDVILPHARVGPGTAGINIQVSVDPQDPEQIFVNDVSGTHRFTIGFRIDRHHNQTVSACTQGPPPQSNAFPATDTGGLQNGANNWLFGLNCGVFGCPANGGWATFNALNIFCRPSGDWVMRATWESVNCAPPLGACCTNGTCTVNLATACLGAGVYQGDNTTCVSVVCPAPTGACCFSNGTCQTRTAASCAGFSGTYGGNGLACTAGGLCPTGACCLSNGNCTAAQLATQCSAAGGTLQAIGSTCSPNPCPQPTGACCFSSTGFCSLELSANCNIPGTVFGGNGSVCSAATCPNTGACCFNGFCNIETGSSCTGIPGATFQGIGTLCNPDPCSVATGACCCGATCSITTSAACVGTSTRFAGNGTVCNAAINSTLPCCKADYNQGGTLGVQDIFDFLTGYFTADGCADLNGNGVSVQDIFDYLSAYFSGGC